MISFEDFISLFYIWELNTTIKVTMKKEKRKKKQLDNILLLLLSVWPKKNYGFRIQEHFFGPLHHARTHFNIQTHVTLIF